MSLHWLSSRPTQPIPSIWVMRGMAFLILLLALLAGYYQVTLRLYQKRYWAIEQKYLRIQTELTKSQPTR